MQKSIVLETLEEKPGEEKKDAEEPADPIDYEKVEQHFEPNATQEMTQSQTKQKRKKGKKGKKGGDAHSKQDTFLSDAAIINDKNEIE